MDKKLCEYLIKKASTVSPYGGYKWQSSAQKLSNELKASGIKFPKKLFWKYKLPNGMSPQEFMDTLLLEFYFIKYGDGFKIIKDKNLTIKQKIQVMSYILSVKKQGLYKKIGMYADEIKQLNPELADIHTKNYIDFVEGALFGFAPDEIRYFCGGADERDFDKEHKLDRKLQRRGINTSYVLAPETAISLIATLRKQKRKL